MSKNSSSKTVNNIRCTNSPDYAMLEVKHNYCKRATIAQLLATVVQSLMLVNVGMELSMSTLVIGSLYKNPNAEFELSAYESSWYGSILYLCQPLGSFMAGYAQNRFGKKSCMILACLPSVFGWLMLWRANSVSILYASTLMMGLGLGFNDGPAYSYVGEICEPKLRGIMSCVINMACLIGMMSSYGLGFIAHWKTVALLSSLCPIGCLALVAFIPESPIWLMSKGKYEKAMDAICWLRGWVKPSVVSAEYHDLMYYYNTSAEQAKTSKGNYTSLQWVQNPSVYRPLRLVTIYYTITLVSCLTPCRPFIVKLMRESGVKDSHNGHSIALVLFGFVQLGGSVVLTSTVSKLGKRLLTLTTLFVNTLGIFMFAVYITSISNHWITPEAYVPVVLYSIILFSGAMGVLTVPWTLMSEIYPNEAKGFASSLTTAIFYLLTFGSTKVYLSVENALGLSNTFFLLAALSFIGLIYLSIYLPETENKTFSEIEEFFVRKDERENCEPPTLQSPGLLPDA